MRHLILCALGAACMIGPHLQGPVRSWGPHAVGAALMLAGVVIPGQAAGHAAVLLLLGLAAWLSAPGRWRQAGAALDTMAMAALLAVHHLATQHSTGAATGHAHAAGLTPEAVGLTVVALAAWVLARVRARHGLRRPNLHVPGALTGGHQVVVALGGITMFVAMLPVAT